jgi:hypothetical protein
MTDIVLRRTGARPLRFAGQTLARTVFRLTGDGAITLGLHMATTGGLICECACRPPDAYTEAAGLWPLYSAETVGSENAAADMFEAFRPPDAAVTGTANFVRLAMDACLRAALREAVGEFLYTLALL